MIRRIIIALALLSWAPAAHAQERFALLIANQSYAADIGPLANPHNDIRIVGTALAQVGFQVAPPVKDATREQMLLAVHDFAERLKAAGPDAIGFLFYSGHGIAVGDDNILVPVSVKSTGQRELEISGVKLNEVIDVLNDRAPHAIHFVAFDACRSNLGGQRGSKGFVPVAERPGTFISFSTAPGNTAADAGQQSSPYAAALASEIVVPGRNHGQMFFEVRKRVAEATRQEQVPWIRDGLLRRVHFAGEAANAAAAPVGQVASAEQNEAAQVWALVQDSTDKAVLEAFTDRYKDTFYAELARARLRGLEAGPAPKVTASLPAPSPQASSHSAGSVPPDPFDGVWTITRVGERCSVRSLSLTVSIAGRVVAGGLGSVSPDGVFKFEGKSKKSGRPMRYSGKLQANSGSGTFYTDGAACAGTFTVKRGADHLGDAQAPVQKPAPRRMVGGNCRKESREECISRVCPGGGCGLKGSGICRDERRQTICR
jgi:uncharacterized caspase-like protein